MNSRLVYILFGLGSMQFLCAPAAASPVDDVRLSVVMVIALEAPKFEDYDFGKHGRLPLAIPNVRLGTGFIINKSCQIMTSKALVQNAVALAVRLPHEDGSEVVMGGGQPATTIMSSASSDLAILALEGKKTCTPLVVNKQASEVSDKQTLLKIGFGEHLGLYSHKLSQRETAVTNSVVYRPQNEARGFLINAKTTDSDAGSLLLDQNGQLAGMLAARTKSAEDGFVVAARTVSDYIDQARDTYVKKFEDDVEATASVLLAAFADHVLESQKDESDQVKRYFFEDRWRTKINEAFEKSELLQDRPAVVIVYALAWNLAVVRALEALDSSELGAHAGSCGVLLALHSKLLQIKGHPGLQSSDFVQRNVDQYKRVASETQCQELLKLIQAVITRGMHSAADTKKAETAADKAKVDESVPPPPIKPTIAPMPLYRFGFYVGAGASFGDPSVLESDNLSGRVGLQLSGGGLFRVFSVLYRDRLEYSLLAGLGAQWHHSIRTLNPYADLGMRLRVGIPVGVALTVLYSPGMLVDFPSMADSRFAFSWSVLRAQLSVIIRWFGIGAGWTADLRTLTAAQDVSNTLALPGHTLTGFIELFY